MGNSDSHATLNQEPGFPRNLVWVGEGRDEPGLFSEGDVIAGLRAHRAVVTTGPMIDLRINDAPVGARVATGATARVDVRVSAANYSPIDRVLLYVNGEVVAEWALSGAARFEFSVAHPLEVARDSWVVVEAAGAANLFPVVPPQEFASLEFDQIVAAVGKGLDVSGLGVGGPQPPHTFPMRPLAITNPIWLDRDGDGAFTPPGASPQR